MDLKIYLLLTSIPGEGTVASLLVRLSPDRAVWGHCVVFLGKALYPHGASLHPGVCIGTGDLNVGGRPVVD